MSSDKRIPTNFPGGYSFEGEFAEVPLAVGQVWRKHGPVDALKIVRIVIGFEHWDGGAPGVSCRHSIIGRNGRIVWERGRPLDTIAASGNHHGLVMGAPFLMSYYGSNGNQRTLDEAMGTLTATERHALVQVPFLLGYANGDGPAKTAVDPLRTVHTENGQALAQPHGIDVDDCYFRMLQPHEIGRGMAFPETYTVLGNKREQVRQYGNAVTPVAMKQILERCAATFN